jgi:parvulin-like peptidyl-prolyl isomerase
MLKISLALLAAGLVVGGAANVHGEILEQIIVKVNGDIITKTELEQRQVALLRSRNQQFSDTQTDELKKAIADITPGLIVDAVDELLLLQQGRELNYKLSDEQFKNIVEQIRKENHLEDDTAFNNALKQEGLTMADLRRNLEKQMIISRVQGTEVMGKVGISEEEARKYHAEHIQEFTKPGAVTLREIFVAVPSDPKGLNVGIDEQTRDIVEGLRKRVLAGEAFEKVAAEASTAPSRANGGLIGPLDENELAPALKDLLAKMKPGDVSQVLRTPKGYQILKLESRTPPHVMTAEEAHDQIADRLFEEKRKVELQKYLEKLRAEAIIEWKNDELRKAYESEIARRKTEQAGPEAPKPGAPAPPPTS